MVQRTKSPPLHQPFFLLPHSSFYQNPLASLLKTKIGEEISMRKLWLLFITASTLLANPEQKCSISPSQLYARAGLYDAFTEQAQKACIALACGMTGWQTGWIKDVYHNADWIFQNKAFKDAAVKLLKLLFQTPAGDFLPSIGKFNILTYLTSPEDFAALMKALFLQQQIDVATFDKLCIDKVKPHISSNSGFVRSKNDFLKPVTILKSQEKEFAHEGFTAKLFITYIWGMLATGKISDPNEWVAAYTHSINGNKEPVPCEIYNVKEKKDSAEYQLFEDATSSLGVASIGLYLVSSTGPVGPKGQERPSCVESFLQNIFNTALWNPEDKNFTGGTIPASWNPLLRQLYTSGDIATEAGSLLWNNQVVSNIKGVVYNENFEGISYEIKSSEKNIQQVLFALTGIPAELPFAKQLQTLFNAVANKYLDFTISEDGSSIKVAKKNSQRLFDQLTLKLNIQEGHAFITMRGASVLQSIFAQDAALLPFAYRSAVVSLSNSVNIYANFIRFCGQYNNTPESISRFLYHLPNQILASGDIAFLKAGLGRLPDIGEGSFRHNLVEDLYKRVPFQTICNAFSPQIGLAVALEFADAHNNALEVNQEMVELIKSKFLSNKLFEQAEYIQQILSGLHLRSFKSFLRNFVTISPEKFELWKALLFYAIPHLQLLTAEQRKQLEQPDELEDKISLESQLKIIVRDLGRFSADEKNFILSIAAKNNPPTNAQASSQS